MIWVLAFVAALFGAMVASEERSLFGFVTGFAVVAALGLIQRQARRIDALEVSLSALLSRPNTASRSSAVASPTSTTATPIPATPASTAEPVRPSSAPSTRVEPPPLSTETPRSVSAAAEPPPIPAAPIAPAAARATPRAVVREPAAPDPSDRILEALRRFFFEGNVPVKLGLLVSLFGIGALVRYAASAGWLTVPVSVRLAGIALAGVALLVYGLKQARLRPAFGLSLQGGAIGILLLTVFGSYRVPGLMPAGLAFALVLALVAGAAVLAIRQNAVWLAAIGFLGGYLAPLLLSTGTGNHVALFSYYALLNAAVFGMAWVRPWRALNLMGFLFTFGVGAIWGSQYFRPELFATTEPFLIAFFLMYVTIPVLYALKGKEPGKVDATLLFGTPLIAFPMQVALLEGATLPLAFSALAVAAVYLLIALWSRREPKLRALGQSAAALGLAFATLAVPLALSARWTSATWALQGVALLWLGQTQQRRWPQAAGLALQILAGLAYLSSYDSGIDARAVLNPHTLNVLLLAVGAGFCAWLLDRSEPQQRSIAGALLFALSSIWWFWGGIREVASNIGNGALDEAQAWLAFVALTGFVVAGLLRWLSWERLAWWPTIAFVTAVPAVGFAYLDESNWLTEWQGLVLPLLAASLGAVLPRLKPMPTRLAVTHIAGWAALTIAIGLGISHALDEANAEALGKGWWLVLPWLPLGALTLLLLKRPMWAGWPVGEAVMAYRRIALGLALLVLGVLWVVSQPLEGSPAPLPWVPFINPLELFHLAGLIGLWAWLRGIPLDSGQRPIAQWITGGAAFVLLTMMTLRSSHYWLGEPMPIDAYWSAYSPSAVAAWPATQAALSVVWSLAGVVCWVLGSRRSSRPLWTFGALLLGAVLLKLLLVDRANLGDLLGIVSFLSVGALLVAVGRIAPRPPSSLEEPSP